MSKFLKIIISVSLAIILLFGGAFFYLKSKVNDPEVRKLIRDSVEKATHRQLDFGPISFKLSPFSLVLTDVKLTDTNKTDTFIGLSKMIVEVYLDKLLKKEVHISRIILNEPEIHIREYERGRFNFSDLIKPSDNITPPSEESTPETTPKTPDTPPASSTSETQHTAPPVKLNVSLFEINRAHLTLSKMAENGVAKTFNLHNFSLKIKNISFDKPIELEMMIEIGRKTYFNFNFMSSPLKTLVPDIANLTLTMTGDFQLGDLTDLELFLSDADIASIPVTQLNLKFDSSGSIAKGFTFNFDIKTPEVDSRNQIYMNFKNSVFVSMPEDIFKDMLNGVIPKTSNITLLNQENVDTTSEINLSSDIPVLGRYLEHLIFRTTFATERLSYQKNNITDMHATIAIEKGQFMIKDTKASLFGGSFAFQSIATLLHFPITYDFHMDLADVRIEEILKANMDRDDIQGKFQMKLKGKGTGTTPENLENHLTSDFYCELQDGQKVSTEGTLLDQIYVQLDHPILLLLLPELSPKVEQAKKNMNTEKITPISKLHITSTVEKGIATVSACDIGTPDYFLSATGNAKPFDGLKLDMQGQFNFSEKASLELTGGKDLSDKLPYENKGIILPVKITGSIHEPVVRPDLNKILDQAKKEKIGGALTSLLKGKSDTKTAPDASPDQKGSSSSSIEEGKKLLKGLFG